MSARPPATVEFHPPSGFAFEPEFLGEPPRPIPDELDQGPHARRLRARIVGFGAAGVLCLLLAKAPGVDVIALYFLPVGYLAWIGLALLAFAGWALLERSQRGGPYRYVRDGAPIAARIESLEKTVSVLMNGVPQSYAIYADVLVRDPGRGELRSLRLKSNDFSASTKDRYDAPHRVGDYVTAVYLPGQFDKTLRLYAYLELNPRVCLRRDDPVQQSPWKTAALLGALVLLFVALFGNLYAYGRYEPLDVSLSSAWIPIVLGSVFLGGGLIALLYLGHRRERSKAIERSERARAEGRTVESTAPFLGTGFSRWIVGALVVLGAPLLGGLTAMSWCFLGNAWLDRSVARPVPAQVQELAQTTHAFLFREYELKFTLQGSDKGHKLWSTPWELDAFTSDEAVAWIHEGRFGWPWVERVTPTPPPAEIRAGER